ncbi:HEAT repeat domain-containing protein [Nannocystis punicea]|uniref:HEAT repeat domain-containing protein n=1 Tax=Nannocystis punicea TaxID=2995304 RepID=A0ABY7GYA3_9BACT|nr:HEAT repeat domain-containing protein [Nannocystis poenicansa]WAS91956.1 HEAT repeat domain-containing protein [Nannocystis poenicansa]
MKTETEDADEQSGGTTTLKGSEYQILVSVWAALDLLLDKRLAERVVLEPVSEEDLEAEVVDGESGPVATRTELTSAEPYLLVIQAKRRSTEPWSVEDLVKLLKHGKRRKPAIKRLEDPAVRYLLVTNAALKGEAQKLVAEALGAWPKAVPPSIKKELPSPQDRRLAVLAGMDEWRLRRLLRELLEDTFRVPHTKTEDCKRALSRAAVERMLGAGDGVWRREDLEAIVRKHDGYFASSLEVDQFVPPDNWTELAGTLRQHHAIVLLGSSGTGKTTAANVLLRDLRGEVPGIDVAWVTRGPEEITAPRPAGPVVFFIEDPWGRYKFESTPLSWNEALTRFLPKASGNRKFIVTSRSDVLADAGGSPLPARYVNTLESDNYGPDKRARMYAIRQGLLPWEFRALAERHRDEVLEKLLSPLEIQKFFDGLVGGREPDEDEAAFIERCCDQAHRDAIELTIIEQVKARQAWPWAAIVWGLLKARPRLSRALIPPIAQELAASDHSYEDGLEPFVRFLLSGRNLRQIKDEVVYSHPRVEAALEQAMKHKQQGSARALRLLADIMIGLDPDGSELAANLVRAIKRLDDFSWHPSAETQSALDTWLAERLRAGVVRFESHLRLAAEIGSGASVLAELARWLLHDVSDPDEIFGAWSPEPDEPEWYHRIAADPLTADVCRQFVRGVLPSAWAHYPHDFSRSIAKLAPDLAGAFLEAAAAIVDREERWNVTTIARGCLGDLDGFQGIALRAAKRFDALENADRATHLKILNGEYNEEHAEFLADSDVAGNADRIVSIYADGLRSARGWRALEGLASHAPLRRAWLAAVESQGQLLEAEALALVDAVWNTGDEAPFWRLATGRWHPSLEEKLVRRAQEGHSDEPVRVAAVGCLAKHLPRSIEPLVTTLCGARGWCRILELATDLGQARRVAGADEASLATAVERFSASLPQPLCPLAAALIEPPDTPPRLDGDALAVLNEVDASGNPALRLAQARLLAAASQDVAAHVDALLNAPGDDAGDITRTVHALKLAADQGHWSLVERSLEHRFADVRQAALEALSGRTSGPLPPKLLALAKDPGSRVRAALAELLRARPDPSHVEALLTLAEDTWSRFVQHYADEPAVYPIARVAAKTLSEPPELPQEVRKRVLRIANRTGDPVVCEELFLALIRNAGPAMPREALAFVLRLNPSASGDTIASALVRASDHVDEDLVSRITSEHLERCRPEIAAPLVVLAGRRGSREHVTALARSLAGSAQRRALFIPLLAAAGRRDPALLDRLAGLLPGDRASTVRGAVLDGRRMPRDVLNDLGDVPVVDEILRLPDMFDPD